MDNLTGKEKYNYIMSVLDIMYPDAFCELNYHSIFDLVIAVMLSAQTTDISVNKVTDVLFQKYKSVDDYINCDIKDLEEDLRFIGLYKNKAKNIKLLCQKIKDDYNGQVPMKRKDLESLPGVGRKTANVVLSEGFRIPAIAVDTHVSRVAKRLKLAYLNDDVWTIEQKLMRKFPRERWHKLHHQMVFFGRYHCKAQAPDCDNCQLKVVCRYPKIDVGRAM